ncbi:MAG: class I SAM-dependent methyltransferase [Bacteroidales bacterium]|jgi:2-polyprenyl-3-methyl-5-hydroxy-6-metoxy-1,4-benzoquinol methylase
MPTSQLILVPEIAEVYCRISPATVLDIGIGFGRNGAIFRECSDARFGRVKSADWKTEITGIEIFRDYENPLWGVYNEVIIDDAAKFAYGKYDLIFCGDILEHLSKGEAMRLLQTLYNRCNKCLMVVLPLGESVQGAMFGNPAEQHISTWEAKDFATWNQRLKGNKGLFWKEK